MSEGRGRDAKGSTKGGSTPQRTEAMEKTLDELRGKVTEVTDTSFNKAWDRVYGTKEYRPSWVGKIGEGGRPRGKLPPPKPLYVPGQKRRPEAPSRAKPKADAPLRKAQEEPKPKPVPKKLDEAIKAKQYAGIPEKFRAKHVPSPLKIGGKVVPEETELDTWKDAIATDEVGSDGKPVYNKVVKQTNVAGWMDHNNYWETPPGQPSEPARAASQARRRPAGKPPAKAVTADYDMVGKYENKVHREDLTLGSAALPAEKELKTWGEDLEIPADLGSADYSQGGATADKEEGEEATSPRRQKWNAVLKHSNVPRFFTHNNYWE